jgi:D-lactate dehydrogenase (cytochrome)
VKLHPVAQHVAAAVCEFDSLHEAAQAVAAMKFMNLSLSRCELLDGSSMRAFYQYLKSQATSTSTGSGGVELGKGDNHTNQSQQQQQKVGQHAPTLFMELQGFSENSLREQLAAVKQICTGDFRGKEFQETLEATKRQALWAARHQLYYATIQLRSTRDGNVSKAFVTDVCVPLSHLANVIAATAKDLEEKGLLASIFGHAGDGNFHCILPIAGDGKEDPAYLEKIYAFQDQLINRALEVGGTCTGEHGVGYGKMKYLNDQYGMETVQVMKNIKTALDPHNIMNPGKVVRIK